MKQVALSEAMVKRLEMIYTRLQREYSRVAQELDFSCEGCLDNCCDSYFLHYTYTEWAYLWRGVAKLPEERQQQLLARARTYLKECNEAVKRNVRPQVMCPLNENGLCVLYKHRLLVCRTHGVPATMTRPDGKRLQFPGCFRCQEIVEARPTAGGPSPVERTPHLQQLALLERDLLDNKRHLLPKIRMTIAEMLVKGPPTLPLPHCQRPVEGRGGDAKR